MIIEKISSEKEISLSQIRLYNMRLQSNEVVEKFFVVRKKQFELLIDKIEKEEKDSVPNHYLIISQRGMGRTTMLKRLEVELHKQKYRQQFIPILLPEEQYNIKDLADFLLNCLDALANSLDIEKYFAETVINIDKKIKELFGKTPQIIVEEAYKYLINICNDLQRRPVLLIDNIGMVFNRLDKNNDKKQEQWALRKLLSEKGAPIVVSSGINTTNDFLNQDMPFFNFFQLLYLEKLSFNEYLELLKKLGKLFQNNKYLVDSIEQEKPRLQALYQLTGGTPRMTVMLFKLFVKGFSTDINYDLDALVDEITPLYKSRFEELSHQQQIILDAIAMNWDAIQFKKISLNTGLAINQLSPQLKRLLDEGWIETVVADKKSRKTVEQMDGIIKGSAYLICERFFNIWFLIRNSNWRKTRGVHSLSEFLECFYRPERMMQEDDRILKKLKEKAQSTILFFSENDKIMLEEFGIPEDSLVERLNTLDTDKFLELSCKIKLKDAEFWETVGDSLRWEKHYEKAIICYNKSIEINPNNEFCWFWKGYYLSDMQQYNDTIECFNRAIEINPKNDSAWNNKGYSLTMMRQYEEAVVCFEKAIKINPRKLISKFHLLFLYRDKLHKMDKAIELFNLINDKTINESGNKNFICRYYIEKTLFELHTQNQGIAKEFLLQAFEILEKENKLLSMANEYWWVRFGNIVLDLSYGSWLLDILEEKNYDIILSPYYTAIQALEIEKQDSKNGEKDADIYLKNRAIEVSEPARIIIEKIKAYI